VSESSTTVERGEFWKEARVEYNYDMTERRYRDLAIVRDESIWGPHNSYTLYSPLIRTEKRALKVAENILANLQRYRGAEVGRDNVARMETVLSLDQPLEKVKRELDIIKQSWDGLRTQDLEKDK
jgi:hypothetical protein